jgi:hypothetical protein
MALDGITIVGFSIEDKNDDGTLFNIGNLP